MHKNQFHTQTVIVGIRITKKYNVPVYIYMVAFLLRVFSEQFHHFLSKLCAFVWSAFLMYILNWWQYPEVESHRIHTFFPLFIGFSVGVANAF